MTIVKEKSGVDLNIFEKYESEVRSYIRSFPAVFKKAKGYKVWDVDGNEYIDFFAGAGTLNYGHNHGQMKKALLDYIEQDCIAHSLDMATVAKGKFLKRFNEVILKPRNLDYKVMFPGPTGTNAVESALKLARKATGREKIICFTNAFHGMTIGSLSVTGNSSKRAGAGIPLTNSIAMPFDNYLKSGDSIAYIEQYLEDSGSGVDLPAAIILETVQGEGGIHAASFRWLKEIERICRKFGLLLIVDDIQAGCGRTGNFFSFESAGIEPDIVCLSKSIGGFGLPMALTLFKKEYDIWGPGEHNGTFRGNNLAFVAATEALTYWETDDFSNEIKEKAQLMNEFIERIVNEYEALNAEKRGRGFMQGVACGKDGLSAKICEEAFKRGLLMETSGPKDEVFKFLPPLIIDKKGLKQGFAIVEESIQAVLNQ